MAFDAGGGCLPKDFVQFASGGAHHCDIALVVAVVHRRDPHNRPGSKSDRQVIVAFDSDGVCLPKDLVNRTGSRTDDYDMALLRAVVKSGYTHDRILREVDR